MIDHDQWPWTLRLPMMNDFQERRGWDGLLSNINDPQIFAGCISTNKITTSQIPKFVNNQFNIYHTLGSEWHLERTQQHSRPSHSQVNHQAWYILILIRKWSKHKTKINDQFLLGILAAKTRKETLKVGSKLPNWWHHHNKKVTSRIRMIIWSVNDIKTNKPNRESTDSLMSNKFISIGRMGFQMLTYLLMITSSCL